MLKFFSIDFNRYIRFAGGFLFGILIPILLLEALNSILKNS